MKGITLTAAAVFLCAVSAGAANAQDATPGVPPGATATVPKRVELTRTLGTFPDSLPGTWFMITRAQNPERSLNDWHVYRIAKSDAQWQVNQLIAPTPPDLRSAFDDADVRNVEYQPDAVMLKSLLAAIQPALKPMVESDRAEIIFLTDAAHLPSNPPPPPQAQGAKFGMQFISTKGQNVYGSITTYFAKDVQPDKISGDMTNESVAKTDEGAAIPFRFNGTFTMYRMP